MTDAKIIILLVEDNPGDARLIHEMLKDDQRIVYTVTVAESMSLAITSLRERTYDVVLLDLNLPDSSGLATLDTLMQNINKSVPIIILTGINDEETGVASIEQGAEDFLVKGSVYSSSLKRAIRYAIERKKADQELQHQLNELQRWHAVTVNREERNLELKKEVNDLLKEAGRPARYGGE